MQETWVQSLGWEDLEKEMVIHSSILAWRIPWREEPGGHSPRGHKESDMTERLHTSHTMQTFMFMLPMLLLLLLRRFSCVRLCVTPETAAHQAPPSLGFFRQEHWSGLPFPAPMHESEK